MLIPQKQKDKQINPKRNIYYCFQLSTEVIILKQLLLLLYDSLIRILIDINRNNVNSLKQLHWTVIKQHQLYLQTVRGVLFIDTFMVKELHQCRHNSHKNVGMFAKPYEKWCNMVERNSRIHLVKTPCDKSRVDLTS